MTRTERRWSATLPHLVTPRQADGGGDREGLLGLLLRCDAINGWWPGLTTSLLYPTRLGMSVHARLSFVTGAALDLPRLATLLASREQYILGATYREELDRLYGWSAADAPMPGRYTLLGPRAPFRVCPRCLGDQHIGRTVALPALLGCVTHGDAFATHCACGTPLHPFGRDRAAFVCPHCKRGWDTILPVPLDRPSRDLNTRLFTSYALLLERADPQTLFQARRIVGARLKAAMRRGTTGGLVFPQLPHLTLPRFDGDQFPRSLTALVVGAVALGLDGSVLLEQAMAAAAHEPERDALCCLNQTCPLWGLVGAENIGRNGRREGLREYYCRYCGARFLGDRIYLAYDEGCGPPGVAPTPAGIRGAQGRLAGWRHRLEPVCAAMLAAGEPISIEAAFPKAAIPRTNSVRAGRLGLVDVVRRYAERQMRELSPDPPARRILRPQMHKTRDSRTVIRPAPDGRAPERVAVGSYPSDLADPLWARVESYLPPAHAGRTERRYTHRELVNAIWYALHTGTAWSRLPPDLPPYKTVHYYLRRWHREGVWERLRQASQGWSDGQPTAEIVAFTADLAALCARLQSRDGPQG